MPSDSNVSTPEIPVHAQPVGCTNFKLRQLARRVTQHYDRHLALSGLKTSQYSLLGHVDRLGPLPPGELARRMDMDASTLSRNLRPLLAAGWLHMGEGVDGRTRLLSITDAGRELRRQAQRQWKAAQVALNHKLGPATVVALHDLLDQGLAAFHNSE
jgi:DNA-binding MarR family transcriptional regulator